MNKEFNLTIHRNQAAGCISLWRILTPIHTCSTLSLCIIYIITTGRRTMSTFLDHHIIRETPLLWNLMRPSACWGSCCWDTAEMRHTSNTTVTRLKFTGSSPTNHQSLNSIVAKYATFFNQKHEKKKNLQTKRACLFYLRFSLNRQTTEMWMFARKFLWVLGGICLFTSISHPATQRPPGLLYTQQFQ